MLGLFRHLSVSEMRYLSGTIDLDTFWVRHCKNYNECHNTGRVGGEVRTEQVGQTLIADLLDLY